MYSRDRRTVLYVEDHPINALLMAAIFERRPELELVIATTGAEALRLAAQLQPVLLLLDLGLPDCHGAQLLGRLRTLPGCSAPPAVAVTADSEFEIAGSGFCELWPKPVHIDHILQRLDSLTAIARTPAPTQLSRDLMPPAPRAVSLGLAVPAS